MPTVPNQVRDGDQAATVWANQVREWLRELGQVATKGDLLIGESADEFAVLPATVAGKTTGKAVLTLDVLSKVLSWQLDEALSDYATKKGIILWVNGTSPNFVIEALPPPTTASTKHYLQCEVGSGGLVTSMTWVTRDTLVAELIPQKSGTPRPTNVADGQIWIDTSA